MIILTGRARNTIVNLTDRARNRDMIISSDRQSDRDIIILTGRATNRERGRQRHSE